MLGHNALRTCLLQPIPALLTAVKYLDRAADAILAGDTTSASGLIAEANIPEVWAYARRVMGTYDDEIHRYNRKNAGLTAKAATGRVAARMPDGALTLAIYRRDGFRCRYCGMPVFLPAARTVMMGIAPDALLWPLKDERKHAAFYALTGVVDHLIPHARGGTNDTENLITSCQSCNYGKGNFLIEELDLLDPRDRAPVVDDWDGLFRLLQGINPKKKVVPLPMPVAASGGSANLPAPVETPPPKQNAKDAPSESERMQMFQPEYAEQLSQMLKRCVAAGADWQLKKALVLRLASSSGDLEIVGINQDGTIEIPWMLQHHKSEFRGFVDRLAGVIEDAEAYCTAKGWWRIKKAGRKLALSELLAIEDSLVRAIGDLRAAIAS